MEHCLLATNRVRFAMNQGLFIIVEVVLQVCYVRVTAEPILADIVSSNGLVYIAGGHRGNHGADVCFELCKLLVLLSKTHICNL